MEVCEKCGEEISIIEASRYGDKCQMCHAGLTGVDLSKIDVKKVRKNLGLDKAQD